jgi:catechol 2,3-dioxygenase-like lactoylglutathione lyase family enzyme
MIAGVHHVAIQCVDLPRCEAFYRDVLGLPLLRRLEDGAGGERSVWLALGEGGAFLALERAAGPGSPAPFRDGRAGLHLVALRIARSDRERWEARLAAADVAVVHRTAWTIYVQDPEGNRVGLSHHPDA